jgi:hypothetical protein
MRSSEQRGAPATARGAGGRGRTPGGTAGLAAAVLVGSSLAPVPDAAAQTPAPPPGTPGAGVPVPGAPAPTRADSAPVADTTRAGARVERTRVDSARRDSVRRAPPDSAVRDSVVARQLRASRGGDAAPYRRFTPDRLRLTAVGASLGLAAPDQVRATPLYAVHADYGEVLPNLRALFGLAFWSSRYTDGAVEGYARAVGEAAGGADVRVGRVRASDVVLNADLRFRPRLLRAVRLPLGLRPWVSGGAAVHLFDVQGAPLSDTFVERALDGIAFGGAAAVGADVRLLPNVQLVGQARYDLFNGAHFGTVRAGASYVLDRRYGP